METKEQKAVRLAWGEHWEKVKDKILFGSWLDDDDIDDEFRIWVKQNCETANIPDVIWRPKSLSGLESNRGWKSIESKEDLPKVSGWYHVVENGKVIKSEFKSGMYNNIDYWIEHYSHFQKITQPEPPIY